MSDYLTIKELKEAIKDLPEDTPVYYQRIEDVYFIKHGWDKTALSLVWDRIGGEDVYSEYTEAFSCYKHPDKDVFVINAHY